MLKKNFTSLKKLPIIDLLYRIIYQLEELEWAHVYKDSIRGKEWLTKLPLNIGRWAGSYTFFYVLNRILNDYEPKHIVEFGLGESSKFISAYLDNQLTTSHHTIIEESEDWKNSFIKRFTLSKNSTVKIAPLVKKNVAGNEVNSYSKITELLDKKYNLYVIDGPLGSRKYSRYDIVDVAKTFTKDDDFIIIFDDHNRKGEQQTFNELKRILKDKDIQIHVRVYRGNKEVAVLGSKAYPFIDSL